MENIIPAGFKRLKSDSSVCAAVVCPAMSTSVIAASLVTNEVLIQVS